MLNSDQLSISQKTGKYPVVSVHLLIGGHQKTTHGQTYMVWQ